MAEYHYIDFAERQCGPYTLLELKDLPITEETLVWCSELSDWTKAMDVEDLQVLFKPTKSKDNPVPASPTIVPEIPKREPIEIVSTFEEKIPLANKVDEELTEPLHATRDESLPPPIPVHLPASPTIVPEIPKREPIEIVSTFEEKIPLANKVDEELTEPLHTTRDESLPPPIPVHISANPTIVPEIPKREPAEIVSTLEEKVPLANKVDEELTEPSHTTRDESLPPPIPIHLPANPTIVPEMPKREPVEIVSTLEEKVPLANKVDEELTEPLHATRDESLPPPIPVHLPANPTIAPEVPKEEPVEIVSTLEEKVPLANKADEELTEPLHTTKDESLPPPMQPQPIENNEPEERTISHKDVAPPEMPKTWLMESLLLSICCCTPIAFVALYFANKSEKNWAKGDYDSTLKAASAARLWVMIGLIGGLLFYLGCFLIFFLT